MCSLVGGSVSLELDFGALKPIPGSDSVPIPIYESECSFQLFLQTDYMPPFSPPYDNGLDL